MCFFKSWALLEGMKLEVHKGYNKIQEEVCRSCGNPQNLPCLHCVKFHEEAYYG